MKKYDIGAFVWPSYHYEPRMENFWPEKDGEWYTVRRGTPRFPGHDMPRIPLLGYQDEADPVVGRQHVEMAAKYGVNTFIVDWYWYGGQPCFERQLNEALIPGLKGTDSKFYLMWANHDVNNLWDMTIDQEVENNTIFWHGEVDRPTFEAMMERVIEKYFRLDSYYCIDGKPVFCIFAPYKFVRGMGSLEAAVDAMDWLRAKVVEKGFKGIHLQAISRQYPIGEPDKTLCGGKCVTGHDIAKALGIESATMYNYVDAGVNEGDYVNFADNAIRRWDIDGKEYKMYFPSASVGWDNTHRHPSMKTAVVNSSPAAFEASLRRAKAYADAHPGQPPLISINSWNEWTEGSYLLPDTRWSYGYLEAIRKVFLLGD